MTLTYRELQQLLKSLKEDGEYIGVKLNSTYACLYEAYTELTERAEGRYCPVPMTDGLMLGNWYACCGLPEYCVVEETENSINLDDATWYCCEEGSVEVIEETTTSEVKRVTWVWHLSLLISAVVLICGGIVETGREYRVRWGQAYSVLEDAVRHLRGSGRGLELLTATMGLIDITGTLQAILEGVK